MCALAFTALCYRTSEYSLNFLCPGPSWLQTTETPLENQMKYIKREAIDWKDTEGSCQNWIASWIIKSQNGRKRPVKTSLPGFSTSSQTILLGWEMSCPTRSRLLVLTPLHTKGGSSFSLQSPKTGFWPHCSHMSLSGPILRWAEERTVVIGSHWFTVLP